MWFRKRQKTISERTPEEMVNMARNLYDIARKGKSELTIETLRRELNNAESGLQEDEEELRQKGMSEEEIVKGSISARAFCNALRILLN